MKLVAISDTHQDYESLVMPEADVFIHAGDIECFRSLRELKNFLNWCDKLNYKHKIVVAGNHDIFIEENNGIAKALFEEHKIIYLENSEINIDGYTFWGSPVTPTFGDWAFMHDRGNRIKKYWDMIPNNIDVLITHGPPYRILDDVGIRAGHVGCWDLMKAVERVRPLVHIFGHIHEGFGKHVMNWDDNGEFTTEFYNVAVLDENYELKREPTLITI